MLHDLLIIFLAIDFIAWVKMLDVPELHGGYRS